MEIADLVNEVEAIESKSNFYARINLFRSRVEEILIDKKEDSCFFNDHENHTDHSNYINRNGVSMRAKMFNLLKEKRELLSKGEMGLFAHYDHDNHNDWNN